MNKAKDIAVEIVTSAVPALVAALARVLAESGTDKDPIRPHDDQS